MFIELVGSLRCIAVHEASWLVAATKKMAGRDIVEGVLGCPICRAEYAIVGGIAYFDVDPRTPRPPAPPRRPGYESRAERVAALLALGEPRGFAVLAGDWAAEAEAIHTLTGVHLLVVNPPAAVPTGGGVSAVRTQGALPLRAATTRGVALDAAHVTGEMLSDAVGALEPRGRLVAPRSVPLPKTIRELARDDLDWVGERGPAVLGIAPLGRPAR